MTARRWIVVAVCISVVLLWTADTALEKSSPLAFDQEPLRYSPMASAKAKPPNGPGHGKPPKPTSNNWAVVIGIADYQGRDSDLWHPDEDAKEMAQVLEDKYGYTNVKLLLNRKATASAIESAIDWLIANTNEESHVVFFFSGHGYRAPDDEGWDDDMETDGYDEIIVTHDFYGLSDGWLAEKFRNIKASHFTLFFGNCYSGGMFDDDGDISSATAEDSIVIASACKEDQYAYDYLTLGNTLWGYYFVDQAMLRGYAETTGDGKVSVEEAHQYAYPRVTAQQPDSQPQLLDHDENNYRIP